MDTILRGVGVRAPATQRIAVVTLVGSSPSRYYGFVPPQSAGLIGFSIMYSQQLEGILSQLIHNFSEMETQLVRAGCAGEVPVGVSVALMRFCGYYVREAWLQLELLRLLWILP